MARRPTLTKYPERKWAIDGPPKTGKSTFAYALAQEMGGAVYLWNTDDRTQEYIRALGVGNVLTPDVDDLFSPRKVLNAVEKDLDAGEFRSVGLVVMDNLTHLYQPIARKIMDANLHGQDNDDNKVSNVDKANIMRLALAAVMRPSKPFLLIWHEYESGDQRGQNKRMRDSISPTEKDRLDLALNLELATVKQDGKYGIKVVACRERPGLKPFILWDEPGNMFKGMGARIEAAVYDQAPPADEPQKWEDFNIKHPFPSIDTAIQLAAARYLEVDTPTGPVKVYAFGDPRAEVTKKNGDSGTNGVLIHVRRSYGNLKEGKYPDFKKPTSAGEMAEGWKALVERKLIAARDKLLKELAEAEKQPAQAPGQPSLDDAGEMLTALDGVATIVTEDY